MSGGLAAATSAYGLDPASLRPVASVYRSVAGYRGVAAGLGAAGLGAAAPRTGEILLKPFRHGERHLYYATGALQYLERRGFLPVPRLVLARAGESYVRVGKALWYATTWIPGRPPRLPAELSAAAASLAAFHTAARGFFMPWSPSRSWRTRWQTLISDLLDFRRQALAGTAAFDLAYARDAPRSIRLAEAGLAALDAAGYDRLEAEARQSRSFCHRDCTPANLVVDGAGQVCLVDLDTCGPDLRLGDLVRLLHTGAESDPLRAAAAIAAYGRTAPLSRGERALLPFALHMPREFWWAGVLRYRSGGPGPAPPVAPPADALGVLQRARAGAPARDACVEYLRAALGQS